MRILNVTITDWGPFKGSHTFKLPDGPGLYFLWGRNEVEPRLGSNGAGKTRLWEAICWCIFGKTSKGLKAGDVANWDVAKKASVSIFAEVDGERVGASLITRTWSPNSWTAQDLFGNVTDLTKDDTNPVLQSLRMGFDAFLNAGLILKSQKRPMFLDLGAEKKAELFSEVMGLDRWLDRAQNASKRAAAEDSACRELEQSLARLDGSIEHLSIAEIDTASAQWDEEWAAQLYELHEEHKREMARHRGIQGAIDKAKEDLEKLPGIGALEQSLEHARDDVAECRRVLDRVLLDRLKKLEQADELEKHCDMLDEMQESECPTCGQPLTGEHLDKEWRKTLRRVETLHDEVRALDGKKKSAEDDLARARGVLAGVEADWDYSDKDRHDAERLISDLRHDLTRCDQKLDQLEDQDEKLSAKKNPHAAREQERLDKLAEARRLHKQLTRQLDDKLSRWRVFTHWARWFKEIRLEQIGEALAQLEVEVNSQVVALGLTDWSIKFAVDRETGSGSVQRGFSVTVTSPHNPKPVPWDAWCGGESQRLRIAAQCGLSNLIRSQTGSEFNLECWDEPTDALSPQGIQDLLVALAERAETEQRQIWVIDHHSLQFGGFTGSAGVIKTNEGSHFDVSGLYS